MDLNIIHVTLFGLPDTQTHTNNSHSTARFYAFPANMHAIIDRNKHLARSLQQQ